MKPDLSMTRRGTLKGVTLGGGALALAPFLDHLRAAEAGRLPKRFVFVVKGSGLQAEFLNPEGLRHGGDTLVDASLEGKTLPASLRPLEAFRDKLAVIQGLSGKMCNSGHNSFYGGLGAYKATAVSPPSAATIDGHLFEESLQLKRELGDRRGEGVTLGNLANLHLRQGRVDAAREAYEQSLQIKRAVGDRKSEWMTLGNLANLRYEQGRWEEAESLFADCLRVIRDVGGDRRGEGIILANLGGLHRASGRPRDARRLFEQALQIHRAVGNRRSEGITLAQIGHSLQDEGRLVEAETQYRDALQIHQEVEDRRSEAATLARLAELSRVAGRDLDEAVSMIERSVAFHREASDAFELVKALCIRGHIELARGDSAMATLAAVQTLLQMLQAAPESEVGKAAGALARAQRAASSE